MLQERGREIARTVENILPRYLDRLNDLVGIDCGTHNVDGVNSVGDRLNQMWLQWGWETGEIPQYEHGNCRYTRIRGNGRGKIMLLGHMDTVYKDGIAAAYPMHKEGNKVMGPGVCDMKSSILNGMYTMRALQLAGIDDFEEIVLFCNGDEEVSSPESFKAYESLAKQMDAVLVLEAARENGDIVSARKGVGIWTIEAKKLDDKGKDDANEITALAEKIISLSKLNGIKNGVTVNPGVVNGLTAEAYEQKNGANSKRLTLEVRGKKAHAGVNPQEGANAVVELAYKIRALRELSTNTPGLNITPVAIKGGTVKNVVPDEAMVVFDVESQGSGQMGEIESALRLLFKMNTIAGTETQLRDFSANDIGDLSKQRLIHAEVISDLRALDDEGMEEVESALTALGETVAIPGITIASKGRFTNPPMPITQAREYMVTLAKQAARDAGFEVSAVSTGGGSDANHIAHLGIPVLDGMGPVGGKDHNEKEEYINIDSIIPRIRMLANLIQYLCSNLESIHGYSYG